MDHVSHSTGKGTPTTLNELIEALQDYADTMGGDPVYITNDDGNPMAFHLARVVVPSEAECPVHRDDPCDRECEVDMESPEPAVWLVAGDYTDAPYSVPSEVVPH